METSSSDESVVGEIHACEELRLLASGKCY